MNIVNMAGKKVGEIALSEKESIVEIYVPWSKGVRIKSLCIDDGASLKPYFRSRKLLAFGDSITHGSSAEYPSLSYIQRLARMLDADLESRAVGGEVFNFELAERERICTDPDIVTVAYGTNDWAWRKGERFDRECPAMLASLAKKYARAKIFVITPIWRKDWDRDAMSGKTIRGICQEIRTYAEAYDNVTVIDAWDFVPHLPAFFADGTLHPNDLGMGIYAERLYCEMIKKL
jgi:lysophospholipase L1-like esterase